MSTYNPYESAKKILGYKQDWTNYNQSGEIEKRNKAAADAQEYYRQLRDNGYSELADKLSGAGLEEAENITNEYGKYGQTAVRKYMKTIGKKYGLTDEDIDKNLSYDNVTGEIRFGGMNMGKPYSVVNGVSYMAEEDIDTFMKNYADKSGLSLTTDAQINLGFQNAQEKNNELFGMQKSDHDLLTDMYVKDHDYVLSHNPYESDIGQSIMAGFRMQGDRSAGNAIAESASTNSGNLDSFAAAEGARQRAAFEQLGTQAVLDDFNSRIEHAKDYLYNLGNYHQNQYASMGDTISRGAAIAQQVFDNGYADRQLESAERMATADNQTQLQMNAADNNTQLQMNANDNATQAQMNASDNDTAIAVAKMENDEKGNETSNWLPTFETWSNSSDKTVSKVENPVSDADVESWVEKLNSVNPMVQRAGQGMYQVADAYQTAAARAIFADATMTVEQKEYLCKKLKINDNIIANFK